MLATAIAAGRFGDAIDRAATSGGSRGVPAALEEYQRLRDESYGADLYDFRERTLNVVATRLRDGNRPEEAMAVFKANLDRFPKSFIALLNLGQLSLEKGDKAAAKAYFQRALEINPTNPAAIRGLGTAGAR